jgi:hypothetical protein
MPASTTLPIVAALALIGSAAGVTLGRSAIAEIDPAYFTDPEVPFHADLASNRGTDWAQVQALEYQQASAADGLGTGCVGCRAFPAEYAPRHEPAVDGYQDGWTASARFAAAPAEAMVEEEMEPDPERADIVRYASYRVSEDEREAAPAEEAFEEDAPVYATTE